MKLLLIIITSLCVWRFPDRDIKEIYDADSYETIFYDVSEKDQAIIEEILGYPLDVDETQFKFFTVFNGSDTVGTVATHLGKGQYGAIEVVVAMFYDNDPNKIKIKEVRIQRDREKDRVNLRGDAFLGQFKGKGIDDPLTVPDDITPASEHSEKSSKAIAFAVRKLVVVYHYMVSK